ncbi:MAG: ABC transporter ATP-binding protein [Lachnospiraceae bacterium]|nr:ABC transporter ATP-binding protein [Lachnospiraceae bacterium]
MKLKYRLPKDRQEMLGLRDNEEIKYCAPYDLAYENNKAEKGYIDDGYIVVTADTKNGGRLFVTKADKIVHEYELGKCDEVKCESLIDNGILTVKKDGKQYCLARFSMKHVARFAYIAKGADLIAKGKDREVVSTERDIYCDKCGRALPGTSKCPHCEGKGDTFNKFMQLCGPYKWRLLTISLFMIFSSFCSLFTPEIQQRFIDDSLRDASGTTADVLRFVFTMLGISVALIVVNVAKNWWCVTLGARISMDLRRKLYEKVQILSLSFMNKRKPGELINRITRDTSHIRQFMESVFGNIFSTVFTMVGALIVMISMDVMLTLASIMFIVVVIIMNRLWWKKIRRMFRMQRFKDDKVHSRLQDVISGMRVVKSFGKEREESQRFIALTGEFADVQKNNETFFAIFYPLLMFVMGLGMYFATYFGGTFVLDGIMTPGELMQFISYTGILYGPLQWMTNLPRSILQMVTSLERVYDVLDEIPEIGDNQTCIEKEIEGNIEIDNVTFGYKPYEPVLEGISLNVKKGEMIGLVGPSGAGKSTLINLIMRLYDVDEGAIRIDGTDIRQITQKSLHSQIGVVLQETFLFAGTILNNIKFAKSDATFEEVIRAAKAANAHDFIVKTPDGYNTYVGEHGHKLSGGERQRIAIARAILNDPKLLILDEATSALDTESEYMIQQALERLTEGRTTFAIAHRLSTLRNATRLVVIDAHKIAEVGTHNELMEKKGIYYGLVTAQLKMQGSMPIENPEDLLEKESEGDTTGQGDKE